MKIYRLFPVLLTAWILIGGFASTALAQEEPQVMEQNGISYVTGGISDESQAAMQAMAGDYNLHVTSAVEEGNYLADVQMQVMNEQGDTVLDTTSAGPLFYANLPAGNYTVMASGFGQSHQESVQIAEGGSAEVVFHWQTPGEESNLDEASPDDEGQMNN